MTLTHEQLVGIFNQWSELERARSIMQVARHSVWLDVREADDITLRVVALQAELIHVLRSNGVADLTFLGRYSQKS